MNASDVSDKGLVTNEYIYYNYLDNLDLSNVEEVGVHSSCAYDITNIQNMIDNHNNVFIGTVDSIDGCSPKDDGYYTMIPQTYGKITVLENLKGETKSQQIKYAKYGGILSVAEWEDGASDQMLSNLEGHRQFANQEDIDKSNTYLNFVFNNELLLEEGKTYLFFGSYYNTDTLLITSLQSALREITTVDNQQSGLRTMQSSDTLNIKDNFTGSMEKLDDFIAMYFK